MPLFDQKKQHIPSNLLKDKFGWPPFSILNTISPYWQRRKDEWENLYKDSTAGRDVHRFNATPTNTFSARGADVKQPESVSEFDPYLCELMYRWFSLPGMSVLDPFSGGCVRGIVAAALNRHYTGIDLSSVQVDTNNTIFNSVQSRYSDIAGSVNWVCDDADTGIPKLTSKFDMVFTCPPYYNLERYTKDPRDLSNLPTYQAFLKKYSSILLKSALALNEDCFFVIVVSEIRSSVELKDSEYRGFVPDTIHILMGSGLKYYNEIILENAIGSLPIRAPKYFDSARKIGRHHQNILVFYKGDILHIPDKFKKLSEQD
jgi:DNA modification methylase